MKDFASASAMMDEPRISKLEVMLEAARRATWDALHGPRHLRAGRFRLISDGGAREGAVGAPLDDVAADSAPRRR